jgi:hypothetical protein
MLRDPSQCRTAIFRNGKERWYQEERKFTFLGVLALSVVSCFSSAPIITFHSSIVSCVLVQKDKSTECCSLDSISSIFLKYSCSLIISGDFITALIEGAEEAFLAARGVVTVAGAALMPVLFEGALGMGSRSSGSVFKMLRSGSSRGSVGLMAGGLLFRISYKILKGFQKYSDYIGSLFFAHLKCNKEPFSTLVDVSLVFGNASSGSQLP